MLAQVHEFSPDYVCISDKSYYADLKNKLANSSIKILCGDDGLIEAAEQKTDIHVAAIVGFAGLKPILSGIPHCTTLAIANKEPLVAAGHIIKDIAQKHGTKIIPIDSEHNAIFQVFEKHNRDQISALYLTASGGPFRDLTLAECENKTVSEAVNHPNWSMGAKISVDSATMMNKALEVIEAYELFDMPSDKIHVLLHPQSVIHSMVEYYDGSVLAQLGASDMRTPIAYVLSYPDRMLTSGQVLSWNKVLDLKLSPLDHDRFPAINMAKWAIEQGAWARIAMNAANEVFVSEFLTQNDRISFGRIVPYIQEIMAKESVTMLHSVDDIMAYDKHIRQQSNEFLNHARPIPKAS